MYLLTAVAMNIQPRQSVNNLKLWWSDLLGGMQTANPEHRNQIITYTTWNIWKKRCRIRQQNTNGDAASGCNKAGSGCAQAGDADARHLTGAA